MPAVSIIVPVFDSARFLRAAVESVIAQTFGDWELVMVDDGSSDESTDIAAEYARAHPEKIRQLFHPNRENRGVSATRNLGIGSSRSEYVAFLDSDDIWWPRKLERQVKVMAENPGVSLCFGLAICIDEMGQCVVRPSGPYRICGQIGFGGSTNVPFDGYADCLMDSLFAPMPTVLVRRELLGAIGGFPLGLKYQCEDIVVWAKVLARSKAFFVPELLAWYRIHSGSWSCRQDELSTVDAHLEFLQRIVHDEGMNADLEKALNLVAGRYVSLSATPFAVRFAKVRQVLAHLNWPCPALSTARRMFGPWVRSGLRKFPRFF